MVAYYYKANKKVRLTPEKRELICQKINQDFKSYYHELDEAKEDASEIQEELFPSLSDDKIKKIPSIYEQYKTYTSAIRRACYPSYESILDIKGLDARSNDLAGIYKASLIYDWYNIDLMKALDKCQNDWAIKGEVACYICWKENVVQIEQEGTSVDIDLETGLPVLNVTNEKIDLQTFRGVDVKRIDPHNLYFDKSQVDNWQHCKKIYRDFVPLETVLANQQYELTREERKDLKELVYQSGTGKLKNGYETRIDENTKVYGSTVEVLEFEGDFVDPDTLEIYRNMEATIIAGKYLARFAESKKPVSSIIWTPYLANPETGRGQSPLKIPQILNSVQNMCADIMLRCWMLNTYPTFLAPKGSLPRHVDLHEGQVVEYSPDLLQNSGVPTKLDFTSGLRGFEFSDFFQRKMENATGINQYMQGSLDSSVRTASEASYIHSGASMRMAQEAHLFSNNFILPLVRTYALYKKAYDNTDMEVPIGDNQYARVTAEVRNGNYNFIIGGSQSAVEREAETQKIFTLFGLPVFQTLASVLDPVTSAEFLKWTLNRMNFQETDQIIEMLNMNGQLKQIASQLGIQPQNYNGFREDMINTFLQGVPQVAMNMVNQTQQQQQ